MATPFLPSGFRDLDPRAYERRRYLLSVLERCCRLYGFVGMSTPAVERLDNLMGKYGEEGERLLFRVMNSKEGAEAKRGLRFDLTVPLSRYVAQHRSSLTFPFRRYQVGYVWRGDRPQRGRYREFLQYDVDIVGSKSPVDEATLLALLYEALHGLGLRDFTIHLNHRKVLEAVAAALEVEDVGSFFRTMDKLDKVGWDGLATALVQMGMKTEGVDRLLKALQRGEDGVLALVGGDEAGMAAFRVLATIREQLALMAPGADEHIVIDGSLARGMAYYTGAIFEVRVAGKGLGSIAGGGRYDDLTALFGLRNVSGVGFSFGVDRLHQVLEEEALLPSVVGSGVKAMVLPLSEGAAAYAISCWNGLRTAGIPSTYWPPNKKGFKGGLRDANERGVPWVFLVGEEEMAQGSLTLKAMASGEQTSLSIEEAIAKIKESSLF